MEENKQPEQPENSNPAENKTVTKVTPPVKKVVVRKPAVRKPIVKTESKAAAVPVEVIADTEASKSDAPSTDEIVATEEDTKRLDQKNLKKLKKMSDKIKEKEQKAKDKQKEKEKKAKKKKKEKAKKEKAKQKLKEKKAKKKAGKKKSKKK